MIGWRFKNVPNQVVVRCRECDGAAIMGDPHSFDWFKFTNGTEGIVSCLRCINRYEHKLNWPADAFYRVEHRGKVLWAWNREYLIVVREFIASPMRTSYGSYYFRRKLPKFFLLAKNRKNLVDKIDALLAST
jgi:hypothetical protein